MRKTFVVVVFVDVMVESTSLFYSGFLLRLQCRC
jgi:hypothetical protein